MVVGVMQSKTCDVSPNKTKKTNTIGGAKKLTVSIVILVSILYIYL